MKVKGILCLITAIFLTSACGATFTCPAPEKGITCTPISKVMNIYKAGIEKTSKDEVKKQEETKQTTQLTPKITYEKQTFENVPIRIPPKIVRIWITPYEDEDGDFNQGTYVYTEITEGRWTLGEKVEKSDSSEFRRFKEVYQVNERDNNNKGTELPLSTSIVKPEEESKAVKPESIESREEDCGEGECEIKQDN